MNVTSREYKLLINHKPFTRPEKGIGALQKELKSALKIVSGVSVKLADATTPESERGVLFLDTPDFFFRRNSLILRMRGEGKATEYTLKCRSEDRCLAARTSVAGSRRLPAVQKLEEDIARPFLCRHSHSGTLTPSTGRPKTLGEARVLFPSLKNLPGYKSQTALSVVRGIEVRERVWEMGKLSFEDSPLRASLALILWTPPSTEKPLIAELSFRLKDKQDKRDIQLLFTRELAVSARAAFTCLQESASALPNGITKTAFIYGDQSHD
jgi:hypothetical protein